MGPVGLCPEGRTVVTTRSTWEADAATAAAVAAAAIWPASVYVVGPFLLPALIIAVLAVVVIIRRPEYGLALLLAIVPLMKAEVDLGAVSTLKLPSRPVAVLVPALAVALLIYAVLKVPARANRPLTAALFGFIGAMAIASVQGLVPADSVSKILILLTAAIGFLAVQQICRDRRKALIVVAGALVGLVLASVQGLGQHFSGSVGRFSFSVESGVVERVHGSFWHPNTYAAYLVALIPVAAAVALTRRQPAWLRLLGGVGLLLAVPALAFTFTRGAIVALVVGSLLWLAVVRPRLLLPVAAIAVVLGLAATPTVLKDRFEGSRTSGELSMRTDVWAEALEIYSEHPVLGVGVNNFSRAYALPTTSVEGSQRRLFSDGDGLSIPFDAHNLYLNLLAETGVIGLAAFALFAALAVAAAVRGTRLNDPVARSASLGTGAALIIVGVHNLVDLTLLTELAIPLFALLGVVASLLAIEATDGVLARQMQRTGGPAPTDRSRSSRLRLTREIPPPPRI
jgi:O-antigen ligase